MNKRLTRKINDRYFCAKQADEFDGSEFIERFKKPINDYGKTWTLTKENGWE